MAGYYEDLYISERAEAWLDASNVGPRGRNESQDAAALALSMVPVADRNMVRSHRTNLVNLDAWRPSDALRHACRRYAEGHRYHGSYAS